MDVSPKHSSRCRAMVPFSRTTTQPALMGSNMQRQAVRSCSRAPYVARWSTSSRATRRVVLARRPGVWSTSRQRVSSARRRARRADPSRTAPRHLHLPSTPLEPEHVHQQRPSSEGDRVHVGDVVRTGRHRPGRARPGRTSSWRSCRGRYNFEDHPRLERSSRTTHTSIHIEDSSAARDTSSARRGDARHPTSERLKDRDAARRNGARSRRATSSWQDHAERRRSSRRREALRAISARRRTCGYFSVPRSGAPCRRQCLLRRVSARTTRGWRDVLHHAGPPGQHHRARSRANDVLHARAHDAPRAAGRHGLALQFEPIGPVASSFSRREPWPRHRDELLRRHVHVVELLGETILYSPLFRADTRSRTNFPGHPVGIGLRDDELLLSRRREHISSRPRRSAPCGRRLDEPNSLMRAYRQRGVRPMFGLPASRWADPAMCAWMDVAHSKPPARARGRAAPGRKDGACGSARRADWSGPLNWLSCESRRLLHHRRDRLGLMRSWGIRFVMSEMTSALDAAHAGGPTRNWFSSSSPTERTGGCRGDRCRP